MGILDKLRPTPRWKHVDPAIRLDAIAEIDDAATLAEVATTDADARVRRRALERIDDTAVIASIAASDADEGVRDAAADALVEIATGASTDAATATMAASAISDERRLATVARTSPHGEARDAALSRVTDEKMLGSIARQAADEATAHAASGRLSSEAALLDVALNGVHKDVALAAFERLVPEDAAATSRDRLEQIATRSQQKQVARRAKAMLQALADAEAARLAAEEERRRHLTTLVEAVEHVKDETDWRAADAALTRAREAWAGSSEGADPALTARFDAASAEARARIDAGREAEAAAAAAAEARARAKAAREAICERLERANAAADEAALARSEWEGLPALDEPSDARALEARFERAVALCVRRTAQREAAEAAIEKLRALAAEAATLGENTLDEAVNRMRTLRRRWKETESILTDIALEPPAEAVDAMRQAEEAVAAREAEARDAQAKAGAERVARLTRLCDRADRISKAPEITLREGERLLRDAKTALDEPPGTPHPEGYDAAAARLRTLLEQVAPRVRELRELDDWRRFANAQTQEDLIKRAEALAAELEADAVAGHESDLAAAAKALREMQARWKTAAEAPRDRAQELWHRFRTPVDAIRARTAAHFEKQASERAENLKKKQEICEKAEALADSTDWIKTAEAFRALQAEWRATGPIPPREARQLWDRFRKASDAFFTRRRDDLSSRKAVWAENLARKEALCARAEELAESTDWEAAAAELKKLQAEWKTIGPVRKSRSEAVWKRFRTAADRFFERFHNRHQEALLQKAADREALVAELEAMTTAEAPPEGLGARVQEIRGKLRTPAALPRADVDAQNARAFSAITALAQRWPEAFRGTDLDPDAALKRMEKLCARIEALVDEADAPETETQPLSQAEQLAAKLRQALNANALGGRGTEDRGPSIADKLKELQGAWQRLVIPQTDEALELDARFKRGVSAAQEKMRRGKREMARA